MAVVCMKQRKMPWHSEQNEYEYENAVLKISQHPEYYHIIFSCFLFFPFFFSSIFHGNYAFCVYTNENVIITSKMAQVTAGTCFVCFLAGLPMVCNGGVYLFTLLDWHTASWAILLLGMAEVSV